MKIMFLFLWKILIVVNLVYMFVDCQFVNQYLGHHFTREEYDNQKLACGTKICLHDAQLLLLAATQNKTAEPCDDFNEFVMGRFKKLAALNDRYQTLGFKNDVILLDYERIRKLLASKVNENDIRPFRIAKNYYQKCVNSDNIRMNATAEMLQYLRSLGGAPFLDSSWNEENFQIEKLFEKEPYLATFLFLHHDIRRCNHPTSNKSLEFVCLEKKTIAYSSNAPMPYNSYDTFWTVEVDDFVQMYKKLQIDENLVRSTHQKCQDFRTSQDNLGNYQLYYRDKEAYEDMKDSKFFTISSFNNFTNYKLNWLKIFNSQLTKEAQLTDDSEIWIDEPHFILKLLKLIESTPKETLADFFVFQFPYEMKDQFIVYPFDNFEQEYRFNKKSKQRWEQCVVNLMMYFGPALHGLHKVKHFKKEVQDSVHNLTKDVIKDFITLVNEIDSISDDRKQGVAQTLNTAKIEIGYPEEIFDLQKIEEFYNDLELDETDGIIYSFLKIRKFSNIIKNDPKYSWRKKLNSRYNAIDIIYDADENIIYIPQMFIQYPFYHPNRSHFFNTASLLEHIADSLNKGVGLYLYNNWKIYFEYVDSQTLAYNNYVNWEESGGKELQLPGFFLTNQQMYWVATVHTNYFKIHPNNRIYGKYRNYLYGFLQELKSFRKAFNCLELTKDEPTMEEK